jgi:hypothetical protein
LLARVRRVPLARHADQQRQECWSGGTHAAAILHSGDHQELPIDELMHQTIKRHDTYVSAPLNQNGGHVTSGSAVQLHPKWHPGSWKYSIRGGCDMTRHGRLIFWRARARCRCVRHAAAEQLAADKRCAGRKTSSRNVGCWVGGPDR